MVTYISILRGINVSGHRMIKMNDLKALCAELGFQQVQTYIQSGNIIFLHRKADPQKLSARLKQAIAQKFDFDVPVITLARKELDEVIQANPFIQDPSKDPKFLHVTFLSEKGDPSAFDLLAAADYQPDCLALRSRSIYLYCPGGYGTSKLTNGFFERKLKITATTRNWKTTQELLRLSSEINDD
jgi:uncharacterized protein (DUF1697 family)